MPAVRLGDEPASGGEIQVAGEDIGSLSADAASDYRRRTLVAQTPAVRVAAHLDIARIVRERSV